MNQTLPVTRSKNQARRYYNRISRFYDWLTASEEALIRRGAAMLAISPGETLLEIGCGTGRALSHFSDVAHGDVILIGLDLSRQMLLQSKTKALAGPPHYIQGDGTLLPLPTGKCNAVFMAFTLELFSLMDIHTVLAECHRVLKANGRLGVVALANQPRTLAVRLYEVAHRLFPAAVDCRPIDLPALLEKNQFTCIKAEQDLNWGLPIHYTLSTKTETINSPK